MAKSKKTICYVLRYKHIAEISELAVRITDYSGNSDIFPKKCIFDTYEENAVLIPKWLCVQKTLAYSTKKQYIIDTANLKPFYVLKNLPTLQHIEVETVTHIPLKVNFEIGKPDEDLCK